MDGLLPAPAPPRPPTREDVLRAQRNSLMAQMLDLECENAMLQSELSLARAQIAELENRPC